MSLSARVGAIEFSGDDVRVAVVKTGGKKPRVLELHEKRAEYAEPGQREEALVQALQDIVGAIKNRPPVYVLSVQSEYAVVRLLTIPFKGRRKVSSAVPFELERYLAFPIEELVVDFLPVMEIENQTEVLAAGLRRNALRDQMKILELAGIDPQGIHIDAIGLTGLWRACHGAMKGLHAALHVRDTHSVLAVTNNKSLVYFRHVPFTRQDLEQNPARAAQEVQNSLRAFHANWRGEGEALSLTVTGAGLFLENRDLFEKEFELPVSYENLIGQLKMENGSAEVPAQGNVWESMIGAALGAAGGGFCMNYRREEFAPKNQMAGMVPHLLAATCLLLITFAAVIFYYRHAQSRLGLTAEELKDQIQSVEQEVASLESQGINVDGGMFSEPILLDVLQEVGVKLPDDKATITEVSVESAVPGAPWIVIEGEVKDDAAFTAAVTELKKSPLFKIDDDLGRELEKGKSMFQIVARKPDLSQAAPPENTAAPGDKK